MTMNKLNIDLLSDVVLWAAQDAALLGEIEVGATPEELDALRKQYADWGSWNQGVWGEEIRNGACQTAFCLAGQAVVQVGMSLVFNRGEWTNDEGKKVAQADYCAPSVFVGLTPAGKPKYEADVTRQVYIKDAARDALGLMSGEAEALFGGDNTIGIIVHVAQVAAKARGQELALPNWVTELADPLDGNSALECQYIEYTCGSCGSVRRGHEVIPSPVQNTVARDPWAEGDDDF